MSSKNCEFKLEKPFYHKGHMCYMFRDKNNKVNIVRADKLVYSTFINTSLDAMDDSWDVEHIDGDWKNCKDTNLRRIK